MTKHRSHAAKRSTAMHTAGHGHHASGHKSHPSRVVHLRSHQPVETEKEEVAPFLAWPSRLFEMMLTSLHDLTPIEAWVENWRVGGKQIFPKTQTIETDNEYLYKVELPNIARSHIALTVQHGVIMLRVEEAKDQRREGYHYPLSRSIRRVFSLPVYTDGEAITAELKDGILTIAIPKTDKPVSPKSGLIDIN